jgi:diguanylate cyclase (GGDEF)-like protein
MHQAPLLAQDVPPAQRLGSLTQIPQAESLAAFGLRVSRQFAQCRREGEHLALLWLEIELLAPATGLTDAEHDSLVQTVSLRLRNRVRGADEVVHMGGHCFAVLLQKAAAMEAQLVDQRLRSALRGAYCIDSRLLHTRIRLGTAIYPQAGRNGAELAEAARGNLSEMEGG